MEKAIESFINYLHNIKKMADNTMQSYRRDLHKLQGFLADMGVKEVEAITKTNLNSYILYLEKKQLSPATISRNIASIKAFYHYMFKEHMVGEDISEDLKAPKVEKKVPEIMTVTEVDKLLAQPDGDTPKDLRDKAMLELLYATGIRVSELISLKLTDVNLKMGFVMCKDSNKERVIPFGNQARIALIKYLDQGREALLLTKEEDILFVNCSGKPMSRQGF